MSLTTEQCLSAAWTLCAPGRVSGPYPRGFWPDVARVAVEMMRQQTIEPELSFRPCMCVRGSYPEPMRRERKASGKITAADRAANTARLLATLQSPEVGSNAE